LKRYNTSETKIKVGITGGIGSGKTFVCQILESMSYPEFYSDKEAKSILVNDLNVKSQIIKLFGNEAYLENDSLNREFLASKIFNDKELLIQMNAIVHPAVRTYFDNWVKNQKASIVFNEAAIIFEIGNDKYYDNVILVAASKETKIKRIQKRDNSSKEDIEKRMKNQWSDDRKIKLADFIINNDNNVMLLPQLNKVLDKLIQS
jgi:dephospho-CoA kinase